MWTYWDRGGDLGTAWRGTSYDDTGWRRDPAPIGYGETYLATTASYGPDAGDKYRTTYFRNRFRVADRTAVTALFADVMYDDGAVIYLNGTEVARLAMPAGTITASTFAAGHETGNAYERHDLSAARGLLVDGDNWIAVEVHQSSASSSDLTFDLALDVTAGAPPPPPAPGIARGSSWRYLVTATDPGTDWRSDGNFYAEENLPLRAAPLGYGESYLATIIPYGPDPAHKYNTTYFRHNFFLEDPAMVTGITAEAMYDDGLVVWLNDRQIARASMPAGGVNYVTPALGHEAGNTYEPLPLTDALARLAPGRNQVAVEVHQESPSSSDLVFDVAVHLDLRAPLTQTPRRSAWTYYDRGELAAGWQTSTDTTGWGGDYGPLGYNSRDSSGELGYDWAHHVERKPMTTYFRRRFTVEDPAAVTELRGELLVDGGAVLYLNGHEVSRVAMPPGAVSFDTAALPHDSSSTYELLDWNAARTYLRAGTNVLAVEVHRDDPDASSPDLAFDLAIQVTTASTPRIPGCTPATPPSNASLLAVWIAPGGDVWAGGGDSIIGRRGADGAWVWCEAGVNDEWSGVWGSADDDVWFVGKGGTVRRWNGSGFTVEDLGTTRYLFDVWGSGADDVFIVGDDGLARHWDGATWHDADVPTTGRLDAVWGAGNGDVWAVGEYQIPATEEDPYSDECHGQVWRWNPASQTFAVEHEFTEGHGACSLNGIRGTSASDVWAVGDRFQAGAAAGFAYAIHYDGTSWSQIGSPFGEDEEHFIDRTFTDVLPGAPGASGGAWIIAAGTSAVRYDGATWSAADEDVTGNLFAGDHRGSAMFAVGAGLKVSRWNGTTWVRDN